MTERGTSERHWLCRVVQWFSPWEESQWTDAHGFRYHTRKHIQDGRIQFKALNFFHGDGKWHGLEAARKSEITEIEEFYSLKPDME